MRHCLLRRIGLIIRSDIVSLVVCRDSNPRISPEKRVPCDHPQSIRRSHRNVMLRVTARRVFGIIARSVHVIQLLILLDLRRVIAVKRT